MGRSGHARRWRAIRLHFHVCAAKPRVAYPTRTDAVNDRAALDVVVAVLTGPPWNV
jgi:hypothetical protein